MLLARLEEENSKLASNPKGIKVKVVEQPAARHPATRQPRPPSMAQLRDMVNGPTPVALRYSVLPPPPMTELQFYMALVRDYQQTAARLPTLLSKKIRKGIPPPLRGVVWQSMTGARDNVLLEQFETLSGESSPYEGIIGKDLGRSFPGVEMFREADGDGQRMLARVLKCFSLYDQKIGYCQGLAFLVGPLLMHMPDNLAFCVLVRLMENYDLRACFLPDLSGLHVRIYQFRELLRQNQPGLSAHLEELQVDPAYVSQWFLSFFAVTCPLPMLFRIYDVIFAEGASETVMRVALSLMRKNESRILACSELEDVMQLLLSRGLWDCYHYNADEFVDDFVSLSNVVSREKLAQLELNYREAQIPTANAARTSDVTTAASRFLGRLWTTTSSSGSSTKSAFGALSPGLIAPSRPLSMLRRSTSKQSLASTLNSMETSSASVLSSASTDATTISRPSSNADDASIRESTPTLSKQMAVGSGVATESKALHSQIEDLLTALSELQRNHALLATQLQTEREEREEERTAVKSLIQGLKESHATEVEGDDDDAMPQLLSQLIEGVEERFGQEDKRNSQGPNNSETKQQLRDELARTKEHLMVEVSRSQDLNRQIDEIGSEAQTLKDQLRDSHAHVRNLHQDKQRLEKQVQVMRVRASADNQAANQAATSAAEPSGWLTSAANLAMGASAPTSAPAGGLRELKLGRSKSTPNGTREHFTKRNSSLVRTQTEPMNPSTPNEHESLLMDLVQAKTAEAVARQEADELKQKLESLKKAYGIAPGETPGAVNGAANGTTGMFGRLAGASPDAGAKSVTSTSPPAIQRSVSSASSANGGFWGWGRKT
ncbi:rab-GTPase-TBC domain-containing protein [Truncatella angustata]|uniref:Rab-GTPase-TBC domain-containing protein n=1 Tax=Truncatella angustata TaxID=152316 RepID=A0A9P8UWK8_9PEZI|nr:rab-GTPase-TBC domain-containing protein [Truncatella angustata]KAH6659695.1 rab-GTPase-TBC domain-containing protein [Truncatella angustata]